MTFNGTFRIAAAWLITTGVCGYFEYQRLLAALESPAGPLAWFTDWDAETTLPLLVLLALPVLCLIGWSGRPQKALSEQRSSSAGIRLSGCCLVFSVSLAASVFVGQQSVLVSGNAQNDSVAFSDLPPAYHDEYSYLLQAQTFASGRLSWAPISSHSDLFHQVHVLNEPRTSSRYFPWTGMWIALFVQSGKPIIGHWLAGALAAVFFYLTATECLRSRAALFAGLLIGCSPGTGLVQQYAAGSSPDDAGTQPVPLDDGTFTSATVCAVGVCFGHCSEPCDVGETDDSCWICLAVGIAVWLANRSLFRSGVGNPSGETRGGDGVSHCWQGSEY